jgi:hypothetical protein
MPVIPAAHSATSLITALQSIGAVARSALDGSKHALPIANRSYLASALSVQPIHRQTHQLLCRDPGTTNAKVGGAIVASLTGGILLIIYQSACQRTFKSCHPEGGPEGILQKMMRGRGTRLLASLLHVWNRLTFLTYTRKLAHAATDRTDIYLDVHFVLNSGVLVGS